MKYFAITMLVVFCIMKFVSAVFRTTMKKSHESNYEHTLAIILPIMNVLIYASCFYFISGSDTLFIVFNVMAWVVLIVAMLVMKLVPISSIYITANNNYECYKIAYNTIKSLKIMSSSIVIDDNIGISNSIRITYDKRNCPYKKMVSLIDNQFAIIGAKKLVNRMSLLEFMVYAVGLIFDVSFLINLCML